jgi:hypothetical protein
MTITLITFFPKILTSTLIITNDIIISYYKHIIKNLFMWNFLMLCLLQHIIIKDLLRGFTKPIPRNYQRFCNNKLVTLLQ